MAKNNLTAEIRGWNDVPAVELKSPSDYSTLRGRCFTLLQNIAMAQMQTMVLIEEARNVRDVPEWLQKKKAGLAALKDAAATLKVILAESKNDLETAQLIEQLEAKLIKIEKELKRGG